jgi:hypothetical protein
MLASEQHTSGIEGMQGVACLHDGHVAYGMSGYSLNSLFPHMLILKVTFDPVNLCFGNLSSIGLSECAAHMHSDEEW